MEIGSGTIIGPRVTIHSSNHRYDAEGLTAIPYDGVSVLEPVRIGANVWIGDHVMVCPGVTIGEGAVLAMGSVVARDVPPLTVVAGNPATKIKARDPRRSRVLKETGCIYLRRKLAGTVEYGDQ